MYSIDIIAVFLLACCVFGSSSALSVPSHARQACSWPDPEPRSGNCSYIHDPSVIRRVSDGTYFRFSTNGNIAIASAPSMNGPWDYLGSMLPNGSIIDIEEGQEIWCPDVSLINDTYYAYYAVSSLGLQTSQIGLATSLSLEPGSWTDHGSLDLPLSSNYNLIDPNLFQESPRATSFSLTFGSAWNDIYQTRLFSPLPLTAAESVSSTPKQIAYNSTAPRDSNGNSNSPSILEGSYQFWWPLSNGEKAYYLFFSSGACCNSADALAPPGDEYKIMVCRSLSSMSGPFTDAQGRDCRTENGGTLVLGSHGRHVYAPGGQGVMFDEQGSGKVLLYYHYVDPTIGYTYADFQFGFNYLDFQSGWPVVVR